MAKESDILVANDTSWFDENREKYLNRQDFQAFEKISDVKYEDLLSDDKEKVEKAQKKLVEQSIVFNEIRNGHAGYSFPLFVYTHSVKLFNENLPKHNPALDNLLLSLDMCDSLRRRHMALSYVILPMVFDNLFNKFKESLIVKNLGSGIGLDVVNAVKNRQEKIDKVLNYDISKEAIDLGKEIVSFLELNNKLKPGKILFNQESLTKSDEMAHCIVMIGVICGLQDKAATGILKKAYDDLFPGGKLVLSAANIYMRSTDPLSNFVIQHIGSKENPYRSWGLNFRKKGEILELLSSVGFKNINIYHDAKYPLQHKIPKKLLYGVDRLPAVVKGHPANGPLILPPKDILDRKNGYNWLVVAEK